MDEALKVYNQLRVAVLVRNFGARTFLLFEEDTQRYNYSEFTWAFNKNGNLVGRSQDEKETARFTWQPHGSQFTIHRTVPASAKRFSINREVPTIEPDTVLTAIGFDRDWITIYGQG